MLLSYKIYKYFYGCRFTGLTAPYDVSWSLEKEHVIVKWKHQHKDEPSRGYYVSVQEVQKGFKLGTPNFVHVKEGMRAAIIRGLKPRAVYEIKVKRIQDACQLNACS